MTNSALRKPNIIPNCAKNLSWMPNQMLHTEQNSKKWILKQKCRQAENNCSRNGMSSFVLSVWKCKIIIRSSFFTCISKSFIFIPCWRSWLLSSFKSFCTNSAAALFFCVRREAQTARYTTVLSSLGFPLGLFITPTRTPGLDFYSMSTQKEQYSRCDLY